MNKPSKTLSEAVAVTAELTGTELSEIAIKVMLGDLARFPEEQVLVALTRCRREMKGRLTIADVVSRLDDGRPGVEEAWAMIPKDEATTAVWTVEMAKALNVVHDLLARGDEVAARMAFKEAYNNLCQQARERGEQVSWSATLGWDKHGREPVLRSAVVSGRLTAEQAKIYLPEVDMDHLLLSAPDRVRQAFRTLEDKARKAMFDSAL